MKELKFRAWGGLPNRMIENVSTGTIYLFGDKGEQIHSSGCIFMQYTGIKQKGKEIYEGDIVQGFETTGEYPGEGFLYQAVIEWSEESCGWIAKTLGDGEVYAANDFDFDEVIGNIYENKELLK